MKTLKPIAVGAAAFLFGACATVAVRQPHMERAVGLLEEAHHALEEATHDKGGHRVKAMAQIRLAIDEVNAGINFDNRH